MREARQFALAGSIRDKLSEMGVALEDTAQGIIWHFQLSPGCEKARYHAPLVVSLSKDFLVGSLRGVLSQPKG